MLDQSFTIDERAVVFERFDSEIIAINLNLGIYYGLNSTASDIFELVAGHCSFRQVITELSRKYAAPAAVIEQESTRILSELCRASLLIPVATNGHRPTFQLSEASPRQPFDPPQMQEHTDMQELFLLDPVHEVSPEGWPRPAGTSEHA